MGSTHAEVESALSADQKAALRRAALNGEYHLLLGAGASLDSRSKKGRDLPDSSELSKRLSARFDVPFDKGDWLWRIYDRAVEEAGQDKVYEWLRAEFWQVVPPYWFDYYARSPWNTVWTLNIDNSFEAAHARVSTESSRRIRPVNWNDEYSSNRDLSVVHLHGMVDTSEPRELIFSLKEYAGASTSRAAWPLNFRDTYGNAPYVIIGARLRDEPDIEDVVSRRHPGHGAPSFYVAKTISAATRRDLTRWGLVPVEMTAEDFALAWSELTGLNLDEPLEDEVESALRMGQQFTELRIGSKWGREERHDFLGGDEPTWRDAEKGLMAEMQWISAATADIRTVETGSHSSTLVVYTGRRLTGRSAGLIAIGHQLKSSAWRTFVFREGGRIDVEVILKFAARGTAVALLFDGMADVADDVDRLITEARSSNCTILCVAVDTLDREATIVGRVAAANIAHGRVGTIPGRLSATDGRRLVDNLAQSGRLGFLEPKSDGQRVSHFKGSDLFTAMAQLENAPGFGKRVDQLLERTTDRSTLKLILLASYASLVNRELLIIDAARMVGLQSDELLRSLNSNDQLHSVLSTDTQTLRTRHRWMALVPTVSKLGANEALALVGDAISSVTSRLTSSSLRERNLTSLLVGSFMSHKHLREAFPQANIERFYESLLPSMGAWSGRYWEQRAILARRESETDSSLLARAESFAMRAVTLVPDSYSRTTLGTVLMEKAARAQVDVDAYYSRAVGTFERAAETSLGDNAIVSWTAYLSYSLKVIKRLLTPDHLASKSTDSSQLLERIRGDWVRIYSQVQLLSRTSERVESDLRNLGAEFEKLT